MCQELCWVLYLFISGNSVLWGRCDYCLVLQKQKLRHRGTAQGLTADGLWSQNVNAKRTPWQVHLRTTLGQGLPWWPSGWESTFQYRRHAFDPWLGAGGGGWLRSSGQLSLCSTARETPLQQIEEPLRCSEDPVQPEKRKDYSGL